MAQTLGGIGPRGKACGMKFTMHPMGCGILVLSISLSLSFPVCKSKDYIIA